MSKIIFDNLGFVLREVPEGVVASVKHMPNVRWMSDGVAQFASLSTDQSKKFPKGYTPVAWAELLKSEVLKVIKYHPNGPQTPEECAGFTESIWAAFSHETHNVHVSSRVQPMSAHYQIMLFLPGGLVVRGRHRPNDDSNYRNNFIGVNCLTPWGRYEITVHSIIEGALDGRWGLSVPAFVDACKEVIETHYPFLNPLFESFTVAQWFGVSALFMDSVAKGLRSPEHAV